MQEEKSILLIDDNIEWGLVFGVLIESLGTNIKLHSAATGKKGKSLYMKLCAENREPSLVLIDIRLGDMDGRVLAQELKAYNKTANLCFFTFYMGDVIGKNLGIPVILKQQPPEKLIESLKRALRGDHVV